MTALDGSSAKTVAGTASVVPVAPVVAAIVDGEVEGCSGMLWDT